MRLLVAAVAAPALLAVVPAPALAAQRGTVTVEATGNTARIVTLPRDVTFDLKKATVSGGGAVTAFFLAPHRNDGNGGVGAAFWHDGGSLSQRGTSRATAPAGRYELRVTGRGRVRFTVPVTGMASAVWRPTGPLAVQERRATWTTDSGPVVEGAADMTAQHSSVVVMRLSYRATTLGEQVRACVGAASDPPGCSSNESGYYAKDVSREGEPDALGSFLVLVQPLANGPHSARWEILGYGVVRPVEAWATVLG